MAMSPNTTPNSAMWLLPPALDGARTLLHTTAGDVALYAMDASIKQRPLLLVHSVNAAASAAEVRPLAEYFSARRPVYAIELPGFGSSERSDRVYTPALMVQAILAVAEQIAQAHPGAGMDWLGVSLSCEFVALAALQRPDFVSHLALVSPTGVGKRLAGSYAPGATREIAWLKSAIKGRSWSKPLFKGLTRPGTIRFFLNKTWGSKAIDETLFDYCLKTTRVPGAEHAPLSFVSASLFTRGIHEVYAQLRMPIWVAHGTKGDFTDYGGIQVLGPPANWTVRVFEAGALPYFEHPQVFAQELDRFLLV